MFKSGVEKQGNIYTPEVNEAHREQEREAEPQQKTIPTSSPHRIRMSPDVSVRVVL